MTVCNLISVDTSDTLLKSLRHTLSVSTIQFKTQNKKKFLSNSKTIHTINLKKKY